MRDHFAILLDQAGGQSNCQFIASARFFDLGFQERFGFRSPSFSRFLLSASSNAFLSPAICL
jgi:hypothetical protein